MADSLKRVVLDDHQKHNRRWNDHEFNLPGTVIIALLAAQLVAAFLVVTILSETNTEIKKMREEHGTVKQSMYSTMQYCEKTYKHGKHK
jgi:hypothetical protein